VVHTFFIIHLVFQCALRKSSEATEDSLKQNFSKQLQQFESGELSDIIVSVTSSDLTAQKVCDHDEKKLFYNANIQNRRAV
jgi:hypothetical protein